MVLFSLRFLCLVVPTPNCFSSTVKGELQGNDASHDWNHIERVWNLTKTIAAAEGLNSENLEVVQVAALLHDINDWKYSGR